MKRLFLMTIAMFSMTMTFAENEEATNVTNVEVTKKLEGANNGMRKYVNNGLAELDQELKLRVEAHVEQEMLALAV